MREHSAMDPLPLPDTPVPFGYKMAWIALRTTDMAAVVAALGLRDSKPATWSEGLKRVYEYSADVFVTPPLGSWILAVGFPLGSLSDKGMRLSIAPLLEGLSQGFGDAQYFCTHRVVGLHVWARAQHGRLVRGYAYVGERGETLWDEGPLTQDERNLGFSFFDERSPEARQDDYWTPKDLTYPDEACVMQIAAAWSIDPTTLDEQFKEPGFGALGQWAES
jgi:hypothetical protein